MSETRGPGHAWGSPRNLPPGADDGPGRIPWRTSLGVAVIQVAGSTFASYRQPERLDLDPLGYALLILGPALLLLRHRHPVAAALGTAATALAYIAIGYPYGPVFLSVVVGFFTAVAAGHRAAAWIGLGLIYAGHLLIGHVFGRPLGQAGTSWAQEAAVAAWLFAVGAGAELFRVRRERFAQARREREEADRRRADEERLRIARELHDVLAHGISVINVQAGVALALLDERPEQARTALTIIKSASKEALGEVRQVLDALRTPGAAPRAPAPGLDRLPELTEQASAAGLRVEVETRGTPVPLPAGADLAAFRIVQEALTNVVRHSGSRSARLLIEYGPHSLELLVDDEGPAAAEDGIDGGNGLIGMRERAAALGGCVDAAPRGDGGFRVRARLPLRAARVTGDAADREE